MDQNEQALNNFTTRLRQLIMSYNESVQQIASLKAAVDQQQLQIADLKTMLTQSQTNFTSLKLAKMLEVTDQEVDTAQKKIAKLIRDINKCITLLSEK